MVVVPSAAGTREPGGWWPQTRPVAVCAGRILQVLTKTLAIVESIHSEMKGRKGEEPGAKVTLSGSGVTPYVGPGPGCLDGGCPTGSLVRSSRFPASWGVRAGPLVGPLTSPCPDPVDVVSQGKGGILTDPLTPINPRSQIRFGPPSSVLTWTRGPRKTQQKSLRPLRMDNYGFTTEEWAPNDESAREKGRTYNGQERE